MSSWEDPLVVERTVETAVAPAPPEPPLPPPGEAPDDRFGMGMLIGLVVLVAVGGIVAAVLLTRHHDHAAATTTTVIVRNGGGSAPSTPAATGIVVPNLIGESAGDASTSLRDEGFTVRVVTVRGPAPAGLVIGESPGPRQQAPADSVVTLKVSNGAATAPPTTTAQTTTPQQTTATTAPQTTSAEATTQTQTTTQATTTSPATTASQPPPQPAAASVPDVSGVQVQSAATSLVQAGFLVTIAYVPGADPLGTVLAESPEAGGSAPTGSHVTINASSGPGDKPQETVPDATGKTIPEAVAAMHQAGLRLFLLKKTVSDRSLAGKVVEQTPAPGKTAPKNAQVLVYMGAYR